MSRTESSEYLSSDPHLFVGTTGWSYGGWVGPFYPKGTKPFEQLMIYAERMNTVEVDATFHHWIANSTIAGWRDRTPDGFVFCPKMNRAITHDKVLQNCDEELDAFLRSMRILGAKLGPVVIQFAPSFRPLQWPVLEAFLKKLPHDIRFAVEVRSGNSGDTILR